MNKQERVALYLKLIEEKNQDTPIYFEPRIAALVQEKIKEASLGDIVRIVLAQTRQSLTYFDKEGQTPQISYAGARRSILDLFRLIQGFGINVSLMEVMEAMYDECMTKKTIYGSICSGIHRRVFRTVKEWDTGMGGVSSTLAYDEFGLLIEDWKNISGEPGLTPAIYNMYENSLYKKEYHTEFMRNIGE